MGCLQFWPLYVCFDGLSCMKLFDPKTQRRVARCIFWAISPAQNVLQRYLASTNDAFVTLEQLIDASNVLVLLLGA